MNGIEIATIIDDNEPGKIFILNPDKSAVYFVIDIKDNIVYINQQLIIDRNKLKTLLGI